MIIYGVYDTEYNEQCVRIGTLLEIKKFFSLTGRGIDRALKAGTIGKNGRYELHCLFEEVESEKV